MLVFAAARFSETPTPSATADELGLPQSGDLIAIANRATELFSQLASAIAPLIELIASGFWIGFVSAASAAHILENLVRSIRRNRNGRKR